VELAVEVQQCPLKSGARCWEGMRRRRRRGEEEQVTLIKSTLTWQVGEK